MMTLLRGQAGRFAVVGVINTIVDYALFNALVYLAGMGVAPANLISGGIAVLVSFLLNRNWTFAERRHHSPLHHQFIRHVLTAGSGILLATLVVWIAAHFLPPYIAKLSAIAVSFAWNFTLSRLWVFAARS